MDNGVLPEGFRQHHRATSVTAAKSSSVDIAQVFLVRSPAMFLRVKF